MNKLVKNLLNKPSEFKPGQAWVLERDSDDYLPMEIILTDTQFSDSIGIVRGSVLTRVKNSGDKHDVLLNKRYYRDTFPNGRVCLRLTDCAVPFERLEYFKDELTNTDWQKVKKSLQYNVSSHDEFQLNLISHYIERLSLYRSEANKKYENWLDEFKNKIIILTILPLTKKQKEFRLKSYYKYAASGLEESKKLDMLWSSIEKNKNRVTNLYKDAKLILDFIVINGLPHLIFYSGKKAEINSLKLAQGKTSFKPTDDNFSIARNGKFITLIDPKSLRPGEWTLSFNINKKRKSILIRIT